MRKEEIEEQSNKEAKEGWRFAPAARITDERAGIEDQKQSQGEDPRTCKEPVEKWRVQRKRKEKDVEKKKNQEEKGEVQKEELVEKVQRKDRHIFTAKRQEEEVGKKGRRPRARQLLGKSGRWLFLLVLLEENWLCVNAAADGVQKRTEMMERWQQQEVQVKERRWAEELPQRWKQPEGEDRTEKKKRGKVAEVHLAEWISVEYPGEVHWEIQRKMRYLLWD